MRGFRTPDATPDENKCPVCGRPRNKYDLSHGACAEKRAGMDQKTEKTRIAVGKRSQDSYTSRSLSYLTNRYGD